MHNINLSVEPGQIHAVLGANGAGKSTLLRCLSGEINTTKGTVSLFGKSVGKLAARERATQLALLPQQAQLNFPFTVSEVVGLSRIPHDTGHLRDREIVKLAMQATDVEQMSERIYTQLSGGEKQRVQLARAFAQVWPEPGKQCALLLDEPVSAIDLSHQHMLAESLRQFASQGLAMVIVVHDFNIAAALADQICVLHQGTIYRQGSPAEVLTSDMFAEVFECEVAIQTHPSNQHPLVVSI